jgi:hypothetical protein
MEKKMEIPVLLDQAYKYGADYLIILEIISEKVAGEVEAPIEISSRSRYSVYDVKQNKLAGEGEYLARNNDGNSVTPKHQFWYDMGSHIAIEINKIYEQYKK